MKSEHEYMKVNPWKQPQKIIALIGARGDSKRLPHKNIKRLAGKPCIAWVIEAARKSALIDEVYVFTDDDAIIQMAEYYGAKTPFREPKEIVEAGHAVQFHFVAEAFRQISLKWDLMVAMAGNTPTVTSEDLDSGIKEMLESDRRDPVASACRFRCNGLWTKEGESVEVLEPDEVIKQTGAFTIYTPEHAESPQAGLDLHKRLYFMPPERSIEIDDYHDFYIAEALLEKKQAIPDFTDLHKGRRAWVVATGPHQATVTPEQWAIIDQDITIGVNNAAAIHDTKYLLWADEIGPKAYPSIITSDAEYKFTLKPCPYLPDVVVYENSPSINKTFQGGLTSRGCSTHAALHLAIVMGCNPICLIGLDFGPENVHAIYQPQLGDDRSKPYDADGSLRGKWGAIAEMTKYLKLNIINACEYSGLECWPKMSIDTIIASDRIVIPKPKPDNNGNGLLYPLLQQVETTMRQLEWANQAIPAVLKRLMPFNRTVRPTPDAKEDSND
ncbi:hypothetical protein CMI37_36945 [Candidatus Pacearchaeota archaeon]|nr:hypothetical protein [Candidatus Pacearchaeota archaeon]